MGKINLNKLIENGDILGIVKATGYKKRSMLEKCLIQQKIEFKYGQGGRIFTTVDAINVAMGILNGQQKNTETLDFV